MTSVLRLGLVGLGKIARDQHLPSIAAEPGAELVAIASQHGQVDGLPSYPDLGALLAGEPDVDAVVMCQPPQARYAPALQALAAGKHVLLEKPPGATVSEVDALAAAACARGVTLLAGWHARYAPGVTPARDWLHGRRLRSASIIWQEDVRRWHPGQRWIFEPGGFGVFDPGINALSILTKVVRQPLRLIEAELETPANCQAPIAARLALETDDGARIEAVFDFRQTGPQTWDIALEAEDGAIRLSEGGHQLTSGGVAQPLPAQSEYPAMYRHFLELVAAGRSDADIAPLKLVADAFLRARHRPVEAFEA
jgi:D-galactose 1-dehydrogenase/L-arabinose 1- dehydrogenase